MLEQLERLLVRNYNPLNTVEISGKKLIKNYKYLSSFGLKIAPVLKSNAYGHGLVHVARVLDSLAAPFFCVDSLFEAYELYNAKITTPILVMGYVSPESLATKTLPFSFVLYTREQLCVFQKYQPNSKIHIFADTGMHREGFLPEELDDLVLEIKKTKLCVDGIMSHFAESEKPKKNLTKRQVEKFQQAVNAITKTFSPKYIHIANSSGILKSGDYTFLGNTARSGIALYGIDPLFGNSRLKPVLELKTKIAQIKIVKKDEYIGYNFTYREKKDIKIAILPIGFNDGLDRKLSNKGVVTVKGKLCPIIGRVSMNITVVDVSNIDKLNVEDDVTVYSSKGEDVNSIEKSSKITHLTPYEVLVNLDASTKRVIV